MQYTIHRGYQGEPVLVQFALANQQQLDVWVSAAAISEGACCAAAWAAAASACACS
jgi:hypothetical protein